MRLGKIVATAVTIGAVSATGVATTALAAQAAPAGFGTFKTWKAAQRAAKFKLLSPRNTFGHPLNGGIVVARCEVKKSTSRVVTANYGLTPFSTLSIQQNNSGKACTDLGKVKPLGSRMVNGVTAKLTGKCGMPGLRSCKSTKIFLFLTWAKHGIYYVASSFGLPSKTLVAFANSLRPVR